MLYHTLSQHLINEQIFQEENGDRPDAENVLVLLTGGASALETQYTISQAEENDRVNIRTLVISVGNDKTAAIEQQRIANYPNHLFIVPDFSRLRNPATREILRRRMLSLPTPEIPGAFNRFGQSKRTFVYWYCTW